MIKNRKLKTNWSSNDILVMIWVIGKMLEKGLLTLKDLKEENEYWKQISDLIAGSTPKNCMFKWLSLKKNRIISNSWTKEEEKILIKIVKKLGTTRWKQASRDLYEQYQSSHKIFRHPKQCREHWRCFLDPALRKGSWDLVEDRLLLEIILMNKGAKKWSKTCQYFNGRT